MTKGLRQILLDLEDKDSSDIMLFKVSAIEALDKMVCKIRADITEKQAWIVELLDSERGAE